MCCHVSNKTAYAEKVQVAAEGVEAKNDEAKANDDDNVSPTSGQVDGVEKKSSSSSYSHSRSGSEDVATMLVKSLKDPVEDTPEKSLAKDGTPTAQPMQKKGGSASKPPSPEVSQSVAKSVDKHGYCAADSKKKDPELMDELREDYEWYKLDEDKDKHLEFIDMVNRHASSLTLN